VYVELPEVEATVTQGGSFGAVESVKATSDVNSPVSGKVIQVNEELNSSPALVSFVGKMCLLSLCAFTIFFSLYFLVSFHMLHLGSLCLCSAEGLH